MAEKLELTEAEWQDRLTGEQYEILRRKGTERAFTGAYVDEHSPGVYRCAGLRSGALSLGGQVRLREPGGRASSSPRSSTAS